MRRLFLCILFPSFCLYACRDPCNPTTEPSLWVNSSVVYQRIYVLNSRLEPAFQTTLPNDSLPISLVSDTTLYVLESPDRRDTIGITYRRNVNFQAKDCGFTLFLDNMQVVNRSTIPTDRISARVFRQGNFGNQFDEVQYELSIFP